MKRLYLKIFGQVQGVGLRFWIKEEAKRLGLVGFVKNSSDGTVEAVLEGPILDLQALVERCYNSGQVIQVDKIEEIWADYQGEFAAFDIQV